MGKGRGGACCGACSCGICCAVFVLLAGVVTWACVWGIEYNPNVNVKTLDLDLREIRVNIYNRNLYVPTVWKSKFYCAFVLNHRVVLHAIDATPAR